jgi:transposase
VPQERVSVRKMKELLRLSYDLKLSQTQIARSCNIGQSSVFRYLKCFDESGLVWPLSAECDDRLLEELLFSQPGGQPGDRLPIEFAALDRQLQAHKHVTLQLLWEEYRTAQPNGYQYSYFCQMYRGWKSTQCSATIRTPDQKK